MQITASTYASTGYATLAAATSTSAQTSSGATLLTGTTEQAATTITLSDAAKAALQVKDFLTVIAEARAKFDSLLKTAGVTSPLKGGKLAVDLASLDPRELFAISSSTNDTFTKDEQEGASLEMQRRFEAALSGPAAVAKVSGNYTGLYQAAADYLNSLSAEEKAEPEMVAARAAIADAQKQLAADPKLKPDAGEDDPVALYLSLVDARQTSPTRNISDVAGDVRAALDKAYADIKARGLVPIIDKARKSGELVDLSKFDSRQVSAIALNTDGKFSTDEVRIAKSVIQSRSSAALLAGFKSASKGSDPTGFSQNIISMYGSMSAEERQASGISDTLYAAAVANYQSTSKLMSMFNQATGSSSSGGGLSSLLGTSA
ncbi:hypothetical protein [Devosia sp.]|uniref:hypothetical protein n=1 Tax=Devosia sp. TaxID=1871048 RepID=UPI0032630127